MGVTTLVTFEEFEQMPEKPGKQELLRGEVIELPPADLEHGESAHTLYELLKAALADLHARGEGAQFGKVYHEMGYRLTGHHWLVPDISITHSGQPRGKYLLGAPALAVEIISESNTADAVDTKVEDYLAHGAIQVWAIYPKRRHMWVYEAGGRAAVCSGRFALTLLPGVELDLDAVLGA